MINWAEISLEGLAAYVSTSLRNAGLEAILVGGACVSIYSHNRYQSYDLDYVTYDNRKKLKPVMESLGFKEKGSYFVKEGCPWLVEFVSPPVAVGNAPISRFANRQHGMGIIKMLRPEDSVKDRLASYFHWNDREALEQAMAVCLSISTIDFKEIEDWASKEVGEVRAQEACDILRRSRKTTSLKGLWEQRE